MPQPMPIAVMSCVMAVTWSEPCATVCVQTGVTRVHARQLIAITIIPATGTVYFSNDWIR